MERRWREGVLTLLLFSYIGKIVISPKANAKAKAAELAHVKGQGLWEGGDWAGLRGIRGRRSLRPRSLKNSSTSQTMVRYLLLMHTELITNY
jgi:hypothetical protein